jgi:N-acetylglucosamine kinase-like BadF-type ATPase
MKPIFLGVDIGSTTSRAILADGGGNVLGFGEGGPGNHEVVGYDGLRRALHETTAGALHAAGISKGEISAAGFGVSGYDWPEERQSTLDTIHTLGLTAQIHLVNDTLLGLLAGTEKGWGVALVAGSGENCWGRDRDGKIGRMCGSGPFAGEHGGASSIAAKAIQSIAAEWTRRGPRTALTQVFIGLVGANDADGLLEGLTLGRFQIGAESTPLVFQAAADGDEVATEILHWAGEQLADLVKGVVRQLDFQDETFDVVEMGGVFDGGSLLTYPFERAVRELAPGAQFVPLLVPSVVGAALLAMEDAKVDLSVARRSLLAQAGKF